MWRQSLSPKVVSVKPSLTDRLQREQFLRHVHLLELYLLPIVPLPGMALDKQQASRQSYQYHDCLFRKTPPLLMALQEMSYDGGEHSKRTDPYNRPVSRFRAFSTTGEF